MTTTTDDRLGADLGAALRAGAEATVVHPLDLVRVERGARRRRNRRRGAATATGLVLTVAMGWALTARTGDRQPAEPPPATSADTDPTAAGERVLPVYAVPVGDEAPLRMEVYPAMPVGVPLPAVDVYRSGDETFVIRTMPPSVDESEADDTEVTVAMTVAEADGLTDWMGHETQPVMVQGTGGALLQIADDQWALRLPGLPAGGETVLIGRGMSSDRLLALARDAAVAPDGSLSTGAPWQLAEHVDAAPASTMVGPHAIVMRDAVHPVMSWLPPAGRGSIETLLVFGPPSAIGRLGERDVLTSDQGNGRTSVTWIDPATGVGVNLSIATGDLTNAVSGVHLVDAAAWSELAAAASARVTAEVPETDRADVGGVTLILRHAAAPPSTEPSAVTDQPVVDQPTGSDALCIADGDAEQCHLEWAVPDQSTSFDASFVIDGEWILAGYRSASENPYGDTADVRFTSADGSCCEVAWTAQGDGRWYVVRVPAGIDIVTTYIGDEFDGPVGDLYRPPTVGG